MYREFLSEALKLLELLDTPKGRAQLDAMLETPPKEQDFEYLEEYERVKKLLENQTPEVRTYIKRVVSALQ